MERYEKHILHILTVKAVCRILSLDILTVLNFTLVNSMKNIILCHEKTSVCDVLFVCLFPVIEPQVDVPGKRRGNIEA